MELKEMCRVYGIRHHLVSVEGHRDNGRVERVIGTLRELLRKVDGNIYERVRKVTKTYNNSYHKSIKCGPGEAMRNFKDFGLIDANSGTKFIKRKRSCTNKEVFEVGERARVAKHDNIDKYEKGRFNKCGIVEELCRNGAYLVRFEESGRIVKRRGHDLKEIM